MIISAIVAKTQNNVIGKDNDIPWYLPNDLKYFKRMTLGHHIILGRKNYEAIGRPLPRRTNIVVTRSKDYVAEGCLVVHSIDEALALARSAGEEEVFICGGGEIYRQTMDLWNKLYLTEVEGVVEGDVFFPEIEEEEWREISIKLNKADERHAFDFNFRVLERNVKE